MPGHDIIVTGFSAGGVEPMVRMVAALPRDLPAALFVAHHFPAGSVSALPDILSRAGPLTALHPEHEQTVEAGRIYVAPPDRHMLINGNRIHLTRGPRENGHRPAIDPLFRTAARAWGTRVVAVLLSGALDDGVAGLMAVKRAGGVTVVQDPAEAPYPAMPTNAIQRVPIDHVLPVAAVATLLTRLATERVAAEGGHRVMAPEDLEAQEPAEVGTADIEEEKAELSRRLAERLADRGVDRLALSYRKAVEDAQRGSDTLRQLLLSGTAAAPEAVDSLGQDEEQADMAAADRR